ncbi:leucine-rich repeat domain-containing protein [Parasulfitobacter algicola]|uniref:Leucine-rich repeat domain-containing protein n=1 Tax=Parasulfitobacter algicola TaxID=2614809 RepID=A0ABX2ITV7_9RHOB|nr:leucine-rich repeat domain-containing protein [Sulfitobacter algicola]NSX54262.1 leucine-rich repeat domain-containing protein [Sulfitobacter algicola]
MKNSWILKVIAAFLVVVPQDATGQPEWVHYFASDEEVAAANCTSNTENKSDTRQLSNVGTDVSGTLNGRFVQYSGDASSEFSSSAASNTLFFIEIRQGSAFFRSVGGNSYYRGNLVAWDNSWLLCATSGTATFSNIEVSKPYLRIFPEKDSLTEDGYYQRFRILEYWQETSRVVRSQTELIRSNWILQPCDGVQIGDVRCIPFDETYLDISYMGLDDVSFLSDLTQLEYLNIGFNPLHDLSPLRHLTKLKELDLGEMRTDDEALDTSSFAYLQDLITLDISENVIDDLSPLSGLTKLESIVAFSSDIHDVTPLASIESLRTLQLQNTLVTDISPLGMLPNLETLYLNNTDVTDISALRSLPKLAVLGLPDGREARGHAAIQEALAETR